MKNEQLIIAAILEATPDSTAVTVTRRVLPVTAPGKRRVYLIEAADGYIFTVHDTGFSFFRVMTNPANGKKYNRFEKWVAYPFNTPPMRVYDEIKEAVFNVLADAIQQG